MKINEIIGVAGGGYFGMKVDETEECVRNSENQICIQKRQVQKSIHPINL